MGTISHGSIMLEPNGQGTRVFVTHTEQSHWGSRQIKNSWFDITPDGIVIKGPYNNFGTIILDPDNKQAIFFNTGGSIVLQ